MKTLIMPLGLSFFTFQSLSYIIDIYKKKISVVKNPILVALYISFFPVISSGPILRAESIIPKFKVCNKFDYEKITNGLKLFAFGMFKKLCIADFVSIYVDFIYADINNQYSFGIILATFFYAIQIYCDFSGYSDMAIGTAKLLGFDIGKNFDHPYFANGIGNFWRRWHISLSSWLRDYVYIPLGGSRCSKIRNCVNLILTFVVSGIWHGATLNFIVWGVLHGILQCIEKYVKINIKIPSIVKIIFTFYIICFTWIFFRLEDFNQISIALRKISCFFYDFMYSFSKLKSEYGMTTAIKLILGLTQSDFGFLKGLLKAFALIFILFICDLYTYNNNGLQILKSKPIFIRWMIYIFIIIAIIDFRANSTSANFIYNRF